MYIISIRIYEIIIKENINFDVLLFQHPNFVVLKWYLKIMNRSEKLSWASLLENEKYEFCNCIS